MGPKPVKGCLSTSIKGVNVNRLIENSASKILSH